MTVEISLTFAVIAMLIGIAAGRLASRLWLGATLVGLAAAGVAAVMVLAGQGTWDWQPGVRLGAELVHLRLDAISALFLVLVCGVGAAATIYLTGYWPDREHPQSAARGRLWWSVMLISLVGVLLCANGLHFLIAWELFAVSSYFLVTLDRRKPEVRSAGWLYLAASHASTLSLFAFFTLLAARTGSWELGPQPERADLAPLFWFALFGFGLKAGMFPLHIWLPSAHANAPSHVSAVLSGVTIKLGIYGIVRFTGWLVVPPDAGVVVVTLGVASAVLGVAFALGQHDLKRLLAYHSVENIGIILIGVGFAMIAVRYGNAAWGQLALAGGLLHVWNHGLFKSLLFLGAGSVLHSTGTREMSRLGGLWKTMPWTTGFFALGAAAICGLPPLNGFVSEWLVYLGLFDATLAHGTAAWAAIPAAILLAVTGALALACFVKVCGIVFLGAPRSPSAARAHECVPSMRGAMLALALACVVIGLAPVLFWSAIARAAGEWNPVWADAGTPAPLGTLGAMHVVLAAGAVVAGFLLWRRVKSGGLTRALTWDCGYRAPTPRMQYTAASFASTITTWFAFILRPVRHEQRAEGAFPERAEWSEHTPETVLERVVIPVANAVLCVSSLARRLQHGRVQSYVLYLLSGLAVLAWFVWSGSGS